MYLIPNLSNSRIGNKGCSFLIVPQWKNLKKLNLCNKEVNKIPIISEKREWNNLVKVSGLN